VSFVKALRAKPDVAAGPVVINKGRYSNPAMNALLAKAQRMPTPAATR
jgi:hypothetical protein